jgi:menaquinone-dependent protoporphyrinogen oxidase
MKPVLLIYATREGQTRRIAEHLGNLLGEQKHLFVLVDAAHIPHDLHFDKFSAAIVGASLHIGKYEPEMAKFVKRHAAELNRMPSMFLSVSLAQASADNPAATQQKREESERHVRKATAAFLAETGWAPARTASVAGSLRYTRYNFLTRFMMRRIAKRAGMPLDTTRDYEYTNWEKLDQTIGEFILTLSAAPIY